MTEITINYLKRFAETFRHVETGELTEEVHISSEAGRRRVDAVTRNGLQVNTQ